MTIKKVFLFIINESIGFYQTMISPLLGSNCRFYPTCSEYCKQCFEKHSPLKALLLSIWRLLRCQPMAKGGEDLVP